MVTEQSGALAIDGLLNLRDLGGLPLEGGGSSRHGRLLRSDSPHNLDDVGAEALRGAGLRTVVDLRTTSERIDRPNLLVSAADVRTVHAPIFSDDDDFPAGLITATDVYCWWLRERGSGIQAALTAIADASSAPILVHCHAGKDRTGVVIALVLLLAGVRPDAIADDYAQSGVQLADMLARDRVVALDRGMDPVRAKRLFTVHRDAMVQTIERIDTEHGGTAAYVRSLGVDDARVDRLRALLVAEEWPEPAAGPPRLDVRGGDPDRI